MQSLGCWPTSNDVAQLHLTTSNNMTNSSSSLSMDLDESPETRIQRLIMENPVIIFTRSSCCMCHVMRKLLSTIGVTPTVIQLDDDEIAALPTPDPAAFIGGTCIGGLDSLIALHVTGHLVPKLVQVGALWKQGYKKGHHTSHQLFDWWGPIATYSAITAIY